MEMKLTIATVCDARPVLRSYFAANITVLLAVGAPAEIERATRREPEIPANLNAVMRSRGSTRSFTTATVNIRQFLKMDLKFVFAMYVPKISIATGVLRLAM